MRKVTTVINCDDCGKEISRAYNENEEARQGWAAMTLSVGVSDGLREPDLCNLCVAKRLRKRADELERGKP